MEMVVVMGVIALGLAVVVPMVQSGLNTREVRRAARQVASLMHFCHGEAIAHGQPIALFIDPRKNEIRTSDSQRTATLTELAKIERVDGGIDIGEGVVEIDFFPNGSTSGAEVVLSRRDDRVSGEKLGIVLDPLLGTVRVREGSG